MNVQERLFDLVPGPVYRAVQWRRYRHAWDKYVVRSVERAVKGWSRFDIMAAGADQTMLPALGDAMVHLAEHSVSYPPDMEYEHWVDQLRLHGGALQRLRIDVHDVAEATGEDVTALWNAADRDAKVALVFVSEHYAHLWD